MLRHFKKGSNICGTWNREVGWLVVTGRRFYFSGDIGTEEQSENLLHASKKADSAGF